MVEIKHNQFESFVQLAKQILHRHLGVRLGSERFLSDDPGIELGLTVV